MRKASKIYFYWVVCLLSSTIYGQSSRNALDRLSLDQVIAIMKKFHPILRQAAIDVEISENQILQNRGAFDPKLVGGMGEKNLKNEEYYTYRELTLEIPTWYGIDLEAGTANFQGQRLDNAITEGNSSFVGVSIPLMKNLLYDKRRGYLQQSKVMNRLTIEEQRQVINNLMLDAIKAYWDWVKAYETYKIIDEVVDNNLARLSFVKKSIAFGERPPIDSVETMTQLYSFQIEKENRWTQFLNAGNELSVYLWQENEIPYSLPPSVFPIPNWDSKFRSTPPNLSFEAIVNEGLTNHPEIRMYEEKLNIYRIQQKLYFQDLLPKLDFNYRLLHPNAIQNFQINETRPFSQNYQYSLKLDIPLRLSEGRANYKTAKLKINYGELALQQKKQQISIKIKSYFNDYLNYEKLTKLQFENSQNYQTMVKAEEMRFRNGESNLFTINAREIKALEALEKMIELKTKYFKSIYEVRWSAGMLR